MPDSKREVTTALTMVICFAAIWALGVWAGAYGEARRAEDQIGISRPYHTGLDSKTFWQKNGGDSGSYLSLCNSPIDGDQADLCQQWRSANAAQEMAGYALVSLIFGLGGLIGVGITVALAVTSTNAATKATEAAERAYVRDHRPWMNVSIDDIGDVVSRADNLAISYRLRATNTGSTPARSVDLFSAVIKSGPFILAGVPSIDFQLDRASKMGRTLAATVLPGGDTALQYNAFEAVSDPPTERRDSEIREWNPGVPFPPSINLSIVFGVRYQGIESDAWYHTVYVAALARSSPPGVFNVGEAVPASDIRATLLAGDSRLT